MNCLKSKAKSRAKQSLIKRQRKRLEIWLGARGSPSKGEASASQVLLTAAGQSVRIEAEVDVEMTEDQLHQPGTSDTNTKRKEDMEVVQ